MVDRYESLIIPRNYQTPMTTRETEIAIKKVNDFFQNALSMELNLARISAPLFVRPETGLNDNLNGIEKAVSFDVKDIGGARCEIVHSLAKWKRMALREYGFVVGEGLYTNMNAIRKDEEMDNLHSIYVDQWDWEKVLRREDRNETYLRNIVQSIYKVFKDTEEFICRLYPKLEKKLPEKISFVTTQQLEDRFPELTSREREDAIAKELGAVFVMQIGGALASGKKHDGRAPDYDDWTLNGDIIFWYPLLQRSFEVSSMGIRVDETALINQLKAADCEDRLSLGFHSDLMNGRLPYTVGGGIGQSRVCMYLLNKAHIGEVQCSIWPDEMVELCAEKGIKLL